MDSFWFLTSDYGHLIKFQNYLKLQKFIKENNIDVIFKDQPNKHDLKEDRPKTNIVN